MNNDLCSRMRYPRNVLKGLKKGVINRSFLDHNCHILVDNISPSFSVTLVDLKVNLEPLNPFTSILREKVEGPSLTFKGQCML